MKLLPALACTTIVLSVAACSQGQGPAAGPATSAPASNKFDYPAKSYDLGHSVIYTQAHRQFTGTGTPWLKACESVVDEWQGQVGTQPWWNHDDALRGCLYGDGGPVDASYPVKECAPQGGDRIKIYSGFISCQDGYLLAGRYDREGPSRQQINSVDAWICDHANSGPLLFSCRSDQGVEFRVFPAS